MGAVGLGHQQQSAGLFVQPMHDPRSQFSAGSREFAKMVQQSIHQGSAALAGAGMHDHARGLVDHRQPIIFIDNLQRNVFGRGAQCRPLQVADEHDVVAFAQPQSRLFAFAIDLNPAFGNQLLNTGAADLRQLRGEKLVETAAYIVFAHHKFVPRHANDCIRRMNDAAEKQFVRGVFRKLGGLTAKGLIAKLSR